MNRDAANQVLNEGSSLTKLSDGQLLSAKDIEAADPLIVLLHGFTAHGMRLDRMGSAISQWCVVEGSLPAALVAVFSYNSFTGIDSAARALAAQLFSCCGRDDRADTSMLRDRIVVVAHSMGGLVGRYFAAEHPTLVRKLVMLGTPNDGVYTDKIVDMMITAFENADGLALPHMRVRSRRSRLQLTKRDTGPDGQLLEWLARRWADMPQRPATLTISGARPQVRFARNRFLDSFLNSKVQSLMAGQTNDGLVTELSVDMTASVFVRRAPEYFHLKDYPEYRELNHSHLVDNQYLMREVYNWVVGDRRTEMHDNPPGTRGTG